MPRSSQRSLPKSFFLALVFLSPLLGVAVVKRGFVERPAALPQTESGVRANRPSPALQAALSAPIEYRLVVQFSAAAQVRATADGGLESLSGRRLNELLERVSLLRVRFEPLVNLPADDLDVFESRVQARTDGPALDFLGMHIVNLRGADLAALEEAGSHLLQDPLVELAHIQTLGCLPPDDLAPSTPDYTNLQGYRSVEPGMDVDFAKQRGYLGAGVRISDCEYGWNAAHEDLNDSSLNLEPGQTPDPSVELLGYDDHGTAVAGILKGTHNGYGVDGIAPASELYTYPEWSVEGGFRRVESILAASLASSVGDVVLLEMQTVGYDGGYGPAELDPLVWAAVRAATDAGVIVVAAAGNGAENMDAASYQAYRDRGHSGAILVGAGSNTSAHTRLGFSTFGQRVDVQAWGTSVFSTGYGVFAELGGDRNQRYTSVFSGTSSAAALVAGGVAVLQAAQIMGSGQPLDAPGMLALLTTGATPQGSGGQIGPAPNLRAALESLPWVGRVLQRLGSGLNPEVLEGQGVPQLGQVWQAHIDLAAYPNASGSALFFSALASPGLMTRYGELLLDLSIPALAVYRSAAVGGLSAYALQMPGDPGFVGMTVFGQGVIFGDQIQLTNSLEARLGL